jgi:diguanylate cyclase (GGDEF)-like protein
MAEREQRFAAARAGGIQNDLRQQIAALLLDRIDIVTADTVAIVPFGGSEAFDSDYRHRLGQLFVRLLASAIREGRIDPRDRSMDTLHDIVLERALSMDRLFAFAYLTERTALDELALNARLGNTSEPWPLVAQLVRRASFDLLAAYTERAQLEPRQVPIIDRLTTLHVWPVFQAALAKEVERAGRFGYSISLILFDLDRLSAINQEHGDGVGDRILERLGILMRQYFRQHDWVARSSEDSIAVLLTRTDPDHASELAEKVRRTVEERLGTTDHQTERPVLVTVSAAVVNVAVAVGDVIDVDRLLADLESALERAKRQGGNRVLRVDGYSGARE